MLKFCCFVLEDRMEPGMFLAPETPGVPGFLTFKTAKDAETYLWTKDCLMVLAYRVTAYGIDE